MSVLSDRLSDIRVSGAFGAAQMVNIATCAWNKFLFNGGRTSRKSAEYDFVLGDAEAVNTLFNRDKLADEYMENVISDSDGAGRRTAQSKIQADYLASMQQAIGLRYSSRIRHMTAAASRLRSIGSTDAEIVKLRASDV